MMKEKNKPLKNYFILAIILILSIILVIYFYMWYGAYEDNKLNTPIMDKYLSVINYNELEDYLVENKNAVIYVSVLENEKIRVFEKKFKNIITDNSLNNSILYLDLTYESRENDLFLDFKNEYGVTDLPCIILFKNGTVYDVYNIKNYDYNIDDLLTFLIEEGVIND